MRDWEKENKANDREVDRASSSINRENSLTFNISTTENRRERTLQSNNTNILRQTMPKTKPLFIMDDKHDTENANFREGAFAIPIDILEQKLLLHKGLVMVLQGEYAAAK